MEEEGETSQQETALPDDEDDHEEDDEEMGEARSLEKAADDDEEMGETRSLEKATEEAARLAANMVFSNKPPQVKPSYVMSAPGGASGPRAQRLQKSYVVRDVRSKYPTEIDADPRDPLPMTDAVSEPLKSFIALMRSYMGHDPAALNLDPVVSRMLRSTKAADESDSEHYQRLMAALKTLDDIDRGRVDTLRTLVDMAQKDLNDDRQHERFTEAIAVKRDKATSDIARDDVTKRTSEYDLVIQKRREDHLGYLTREEEAKKIRCRLALLEAFPDRPLTKPLRRKDTNFDRRTEYLRDRID